MLVLILNVKLKVNSISQWDIVLHLLSHDVFVFVCKQDWHQFTDKSTERARPEQQNARAP